jgi:hypothetical protein
MPGEQAAAQLRNLGRQRLNLGQAPGVRRLMGKNGGKEAPDVLVIGGPLSQPGCRFQVDV